MMKIMPAILLMLFLSSCASKTINEVNDFSMSGVRYTESVVVLLDSVNEKIITFDSNELVMTRVGWQKMQSDNLSEIYTKKDKSLSMVRFEIKRFKDQTLLLNKYFENLNKITTYKAADEVSAETDSLVNSLNNLNTSIGKKVLLDDDQRSKVKALSGEIANTYQAGKIRSLMKKDATVIGMSLALQVQQMKNLSAMMDSIKTAENINFESNYVQGPYIAMKPLDAEKWKGNRGKLKKAQDSVGELESAVSAAKALLDNWVTIVTGKGQMESIFLNIEHVKNFTETLNVIDNEIPNEKVGAK